MFVKISEEKISENTKGEGNPMYNHKHTDETRRKMSESAKTRTGEKSGFYKHTHTDEVKRKISEKNKGKPSWNKDKVTPESVRRKISEAKKGKPNPQSKYKYLTPQGEIREMHPSHISQWHKDWIRIEE